VTTQELLAEFTELMNRHGVYSLAAADFLWDHFDNKEFVSLAETARDLKEAMENKP
jgi:hypothetical protein